MFRQIMWSSITVLAFSSPAFAEDILTSPEGTVISAGIGGTLAKACDDNCTNRAEFAAWTGAYFFSYSSNQVKKDIADTEKDHRVFRYQGINVGYQLVFSGYEWFYLKGTGGPYQRVLQNSDLDNDSEDEVNTGLSILGSIGVRTVGWPVVLGYEMQVEKFQHESLLLQSEMIYLGLAIDSL